MLATQYSKIGAALAVLAVVLTACASPQPPMIAAADPPPAQTGMAELDLIIAAVLRGDTEKVRSLIDYSQAQCTFAEGLGGPPKCLSGEKAGARVEVLPILGAEGGFIRKAEIASWSGLDVTELYAAYEVSEAVFSDSNYPAGQYALVFAGGTQATSRITLQVRRGRIVRIDYDFGGSSEIRPEYVIRYLVWPDASAP